MVRSLETSLIKIYSSDVDLDYERKIRLYKSLHRSALEQRRLAKFYGKGTKEGDFHYNWARLVEKQAAELNVPIKDIAAADLSSID